MYTFIASSHGKGKEGNFFKVRTHILSLNLLLIQGYLNIQISSYVGYLVFGRKI